MKRRFWKWFLLCLLCVTGVWLLWHRESGRDGSPSRPSATVAPAVRPHLSSAAPSRGVINTNPAQISLAEWNTNKFAGRLSNTLKPIGDLVNDSHAILLANAFIDTQLPLNFVFPKNLQPQGDPGAYIVQAHGPIDNAFRAMLTGAGATIVAYIPNDAYLVRATAGVAGALGANPQTQAVVPYEPYYKIQSSLLYPAVEQLRQPNGAMLTLGLFADDTTATVQQIEQLGGQVVGQDRSPFGPVVRVVPPRDWTTLATLSGVQIVEPFHKRTVANDLARATVGVAEDSLTPTNYLSLTGSNIIVEVNDTGIDATHPDLAGGGVYGKPAAPFGVIGDVPQSLVDTNGHGTHVAGIIAGDGVESITVTNAPGSTLTNLNGTVSGVPSGSPEQFRGMAPAAILYSVGGIAGGSDTNIFNFLPDQYFQEAPALTNALISNNSWVNEGDTAYDLSAASYDAAVRDALPFVTGSQPVLFVFAAGNAGNGSDSEDLGGGIADSIESPATAKNVISVGALQENRNITTIVTNADGSTGQPWQAMTSTGYRVAGFSSRGNVGIGTEGEFGRYKPDVCAPGTFIISTRSEQWDINTYFYQNPTNDQIQIFSGFIVQPGSTVVRPFPTIPTNAVQLTIATFPNAHSPFSFAVLPTLIGLFTSPGFQYITFNDPVLIPPDPNAPSIQQILASGQGFTGAFNFAISNNTSSQVIFDLLTDIETTNGSGTFFLALSNLDQELGTLNPASTGPGPYYRFETGTSMAAPVVSGSLALMQEFYAKAYSYPPSPAMLKAMLINGAQATGLYNYQVQNTLNYEGWGAMNLPDSLPPGFTNQLNAACSTYVQDQNPTNALATGDSQTWLVQTTNALPLRVTLAWTDPPGDPTAALKLVNNLVLVVTNFSNPTNPIVYFGNDIGPSSIYNNPRGTNTLPIFDSINNVQTVNLPQSAGTNFSITVMGFRVNVNAVTAQSNNVVQDYALVISCGNGQEPTVMSVSAVPPVTPPTYPPIAQQIDFLSGTNVNAALINELVGANTPLLGTTTVPVGTLMGLDTNGLPIPLTDFASNAVVTVGMTNQWHFYIVTNSFAGTNAAFTNAAFVTFNPNAPDPDTLSIPRLGGFAGTPGNASREADIDLYVTTDPTITNLNPVAISNCVHGTQVGLSTPLPAFNGASLGRGTTEFVVDIDSRAGEVYYIGVKSEDQMAAEYGFISIFSATPFSTINNGNQEVNGVPVPMAIPDGSPTVPGRSYVFGLAIYPMTVGTVTVHNVITHQNFGDLIGTLTLNGGHADVLNNHDSFGNAPGPYDLIYDDSAGGGIPGSRPSDGPGSLVGYMGQQGIGVWQLTEVDDSSTQIGTVNGFNLTMQPQQDLNGAIEAFSVPAGSWFYGFVDVPPGATNLTVVATNITPVVSPPLEMFIKFGSQPTTNSFDLMTFLNIPGPGGTTWGFISDGPPLTSGRYFVGIFNPSATPASGFIYATISSPFVPAQKIYSSTDTPAPLLDDAITTDSITVPDNQTVASLDVAISVQHPRISDLVFHLIGPDGTRELLMENRGGTNSNGAGGVATVVTNVALTNTFEGQPATNYTFGQVVGGWDVAANQVTVQTDPANAYPGKTNLLALANGALSATLNTVPGARYTLTFAYRGPGIAGWWRGESNLIDSINGNNATWENGTPVYTNGEVDSAFNLDSPANYMVVVPASGNWSFGQNGGFTLEGWVDPVSTASGALFAEYERALATSSGADVGAQFILNNIPNLGTIPGALGANIKDTANNDHIFGYAGSLLTVGSWQHVALSYNKTTGVATLYYNGTPMIQTNFGVFTPQTGFTNLLLGARTTFNSVASPGGKFSGGMDEISLYDRALSDSEIQAIHQNNTAGKFDPFEFTNSPPQSQVLSLAEAQITVNGTVLTNLFGNNTNWQTYSVSFTAASAFTTLQIQGIEPGMLLDGSSVVSIQTNYNYLVFTENTNLTTTPIKFAPPPLGPLAGYVQWPLSAGGNGHWYKAVANPSQSSGLTWAVADQIAQSEGGYLATIGNLAENNFVFSLINQPQFFTGGNLIGGNGAGPAIGGFNNGAGWTWENGDAWTWTPMVFPWFAGQPNDPPPTRIIYFSGTQGVPANTWDDYGPNDHNTGGYVIERNSMPGFNLPEEPLIFFNGLNAQGTWTLEVQDDRVGATNPAPLLLSWQLRFTYVTTGTNAAGIPPGTTATNVIPAGGWEYFPVNVPPSADWATNILVFATGPLDMWFNPTNNPVGTTPPDFELLAASTGGSSTLSLTSSPTNIVPGTTYFIGLHNTNTFPVTNGFQVDFHLIPPPIPLTNGVPITNIITAAVVGGGQTRTVSGLGGTIDGLGPASGNGIAYFSITVPPDVDYVTNTLIFATLPVNLWFNQNGQPNGTNPPNYELLANATSGSFVLSANSLPPLEPGFTYYLALQNTNGVPVTNAFVVNFHFRNPITGPGITVTNINGTNGFLVRWSGPTNYQYLIQWKTNLASGFPWNTVSNPVINVTYNPPNGNYSWLDDGSLTGGWSPQKFYRILANFVVEPPTNGTPVTNVVVSGSITPLTVSVPANAIAATNVLVSATGPVNVYFNQTGPPTGNTNAGDVLLLSNVTGGNFLLTGSSMPPLVPGAKYYLGVQNPGTSNVSFVFQVNFAYGSALGSPPSISSISTTNINGTNAILLKWVAPTNYQFQIQWAANLTSATAWHTIPNVVVTWSGVVSPTNNAYGIFQFLDDGSLTGGLGPWKFYRLIEYPYSTPIPQTLTIINTGIIGNAVRFQWVAPTNYQYEVLWTTNLASPLATWSILANPILGLSNGVYTFTDTNQTGPPAGPKFYRVLEH
jgi:subtilisin-like proprotein convertase family protein